MEYLAGSRSTYTIAAQPASSLPTGTVQINDVPVAADGVAWYRIRRRGVDGSHEKIFNLYTTTSGGEFINDPGAWRSTGSPTSSRPRTAPQRSRHSMSISSGRHIVYRPELLVWTPTAPWSTPCKRQTRWWPVCTEADIADPAVRSFTAFSDRTTKSPIRLRARRPVTSRSLDRLRTAAGTASWISSYTNRTSATNVAKNDLVAAPEAKPDLDDHRRRPRRPMATANSSSATAPIR